MVTEPNLFNSQNYKFVHVSLLALNLALLSLRVIAHVDCKIMWSNRWDIHSVLAQYTLSRCAKADTDKTTITVGKKSFTVWFTV